MTENPDSILNALPTKLRDARKAQGLSLDAISNLSGVSRSMVSQIERGESSPTIATLWNLTRALNVDFSGLMAREDKCDRVDVLRAAEVPTIDNIGTGCRIAILSPPQDAGGHEVYDITFGQNGRLSSQPHAAGVNEQLTVMEGRVKIVSGTAASDLTAGDSARYAADVPHEIAAIDGPARVFLIVKAA